MTDPSLHKEELYKKLERFYEREEMSHPAYPDTIPNDFNDYKEAWIAELEALLSREITKAIYAMHADFIGTDRLVLGKETDQAFNYARIHRWIDDYIARLGDLQEGKE